MQANTGMVSIVVPIFNMEKCLKRCVDSILNQTYKNLEVILVDDGSEDESGKICKVYERENERVTAILKENGGVSTARNAGLDVAKGEWVMFVDPDDFLSRVIVEQLLSVCTSMTDIAICACTTLDGEKCVPCHFFEGNRVFVSNVEKKELHKQLMDMKYGQDGTKIYTAIGVPWGKLYRTSMLKEHQLTFNTALRRVQDNIFNTYAFTYAREIKYIDAPLYMYNYEHMSSYFAHFRSNYAQIFLEVRKAKYECMSNLGLLEDDDLYKFYVNETIVNQASIIKFGIFHRENPATLSEKLKFAREIGNLECFRVYMNFKGYRMINNMKYKSFWFALYIKFYYLIFLLSGMK